MLEFLVTAFILAFVGLAILGHVLLFRAILHGHGRIPDRGLNERPAPASHPKTRHAMPV